MGAARKQLKESLEAANQRADELAAAPLDAWRKITQGLTFYKGHNGSDVYLADHEQWQPDREGLKDSTQTEAQIVSSLLVDETGVADAIYGKGGLHRVALDIDLPVVVMPSTQEGHFHLYIDKEMTWEKYEKLLFALVEAGIVEPGYHDMAKKRRATHLRTPWTKKATATGGFVS